MSLLNKDQIRQLKFDVSKYAPVPTVDIWEYSLRKVVVSTIAIAMFTGFSGLDLDAFPQSYVLTQIIIFALSYWYYKTNFKKYLEALDKAENEYLRS